ncbi:MAG TPA: hypothetical protein PK576_00370 [Kiritimatiellia bacterium]|nr:hypothetical protein [Kiritimatiellia bacterium]
MRKQALFAVVGMMPVLASGWGAGHDTVARALALRMPEPWCTHLQGEVLRTFCADSHYPDSFLKLSEDPRITPEEKAFLEGCNPKMTVRYHFHSDTGRGVAFTLMVRALRENRRESALLWFAILGHSTADMVACNHDPIAHLATYAWGDKGWGLRFPDGTPMAAMQSGLDLGWVEKESAAKAVWDARVANMSATDSGKSADEALLDVMRAGLDGVGVCSAHGLPIVEAAAEWTMTRKAESCQELAKRLSDLGCWAVERLLRDFLTAQRLAAGDSDPSMTEAVRQRFNVWFDEFVANRNYNEDSFVKGLTTAVRPDAPLLGVLSEPTWRMNEGMLGPNDRVLAAQAATSLRKRGRNAVLLDVRRVMAEGISAERVPLLLVFAQKTSPYHGMDPKVLVRRLIAYRAAGGKLIWIGGSVPNPALCGFPQELVAQADVGKGYAYALTRLPVGTNAYAHLSLKIGDRAAYPLSRSPNFSAGWHVPSNKTFFKSGADEHVLPIAHLLDRDRVLLVGAAWPRNQPAVAYLPVYVLFPYLWTDESPVFTPFEIGLDSVGNEALEAAFAALQVAP